jgi:anaerobic C4-dicarboxylate transporter
MLNSVLYIVLRVEREQKIKEKIRMYNPLLFRLKKALAVITASALSVAIWGFFAVWIMILFEKSYDLVTVIVGTLLMLVFAGSTAWDIYVEWRKMKNETERNIG